MSTLLGCSNGHYWSPDAGNATGVCPWCAEPGRPHQPGESDASLPTHRDLPPPPRAPLELPHVPGYEVLGVLGRGGMGVVYKARQTSVGRIVALKMIRGAESAGPEEVIRFRAEAEAVGQLQHPNIVQIHEVGEHQGRPFLALEYVPGMSLDQRVAQGPAPAQEGAALVAILARAVHHAHQRGIIHRDLKPANVLLQDEEAAASDGGRNAGSGQTPTLKPSPMPAPARISSLGIPKITDFGLAKHVTKDASLTQTGVVLGTPHYMAPEQAGGKTKLITSATDVYALGAILFELLTGRPPFDGGSAMDTIKKVIEEEPTPPRRLVPNTPRDLETICLKCLHKAPERRYESALALAEDVDRFLEGRPILARRVGRAERLLKWARRRPAAAALVAVSVVALAILVGVFLWSYREIDHALADTRIERDKATRQGERAERNFDHARKAIKELMRVAKEKLGHIPRMEQEQRAILVSAVNYFETLQKEENDDPAVRRDMGEAYGLMGYAEEQFGNYDQAEIYLRRSLKIREEMAAAFPAESESQRDLAGSLTFMGNLFDNMARHAESEDMYRKSLALRAQLAARFPDHQDYARELGNGYYNFGLMLRDIARNEEAEKHFDQALAIWATLAKKHPRDPVHVYDLAGVYLSLGAVYQDTGRFQAAVKAYRQALEFKDQLAALDEGYATRPFHRAEVARLYAHLGDVLKTLGKLSEAEKALRQAVAVGKRLTEDYPTAPYYHKERDQRYAALAQLLAETGRPTAELDSEATAHWKQLPDDFAAKLESRGERANFTTIGANRLRVIGKHKEAADAYRQAVALWQQLVDDCPAVPRYVGNLANAQAELAALEDHLGQTKEAEATLRRALEPRTKLAADFPLVPGFAVDLIQGYVQLGGLMEKAKRLPEAEEAYRRAVALRQKAAKDFPGQLRHRVNCGHDLVRLAKLLERHSKEAESVYGEALSHFEKLAAEFPDVPAHQSEAAAQHGKLARIFEANNRLKEAEDSYRQALRLRLNIRTAVPESLDCRGLLGDTHFDLGFFLQKRNRHKEAVPELTNARDLYGEIHAEFPKVIVYQRHYALASNNLGNALWATDRPDDAAKSFMQAQKVQQDVVKKNAKDPQDRYQLARFCHNLGLLQLNRLRLPDEAAAPLGEAGRIMEGLVKEVPGNIEFRTFLGDIQSDLARAFLSREEMAKARPCLEAAIVHLKTVLKIEPKNARVATTLGQQYHSLVKVLVLGEDHAAAKKAVLELCEVLPDPAENHVVAAWGFACCIRLVQEDRRLSAADRELAVEALGAQAVLALRRSHERRFLQLEKLLALPEFDALRGRSDFKTLLKEIEKGK